MDYWSVSNSFKAEYPKLNYTGIGGKNMAKFISYQITTKTLMLKLKKNENISVILNGPKIPFY